MDSRPWKWKSGPSLPHNKDKWRCTHLWSAISLIRNYIWSASDLWSVRGTKIAFSCEVTEEVFFVLRLICWIVSGWKMVFGNNFLEGVAPAFVGSVPLLVPLCGRSLDASSSSPALHSGSGEFHYLERGTSNKPLRSGSIHSLLIYPWFIYLSHMEAPRNQCYYKVHSDRPVLFTYVSWGQPRLLVDTWD